jgi:hypothetical protein
MANYLAKSLGLVLVMSSSLTAYAKNASEFYTSYQFPQIQEEKFDDSIHLTMKKEWAKQSRKVASATNFQEGDLSSDFKTIRTSWLNVTTGDQMEKLLRESYSKFDTYAPDTKYFLAQMHLALPLRGIVWRMRKLFETSRGFLGNKSTHVMAIQAIRGSVTGLKIFLPTKQTDAGIEFFTEPSKAMTSADQFTSLAEFQNYLMLNVLPALTESIERIQGIQKSHPDATFVWDNKMAFGTGTFDDEISRYVGNGPAEVNFLIAGLYRAQHDLLVYCSYNQDRAIEVAGKLGAHIGIDSGVFSSKADDLGITDKEKVSTLKEAASKHKFLELRNYGGSKFATKALVNAYVSLKNSVIYFERAYDYLQTKDGNKSMALNPVLFQPEIAKNMENGIKNMKAVVQGPSEVRDPVTGKVVTIDLPAFYKSPPQSLSVLMASKFENGDNEKAILNTKGEKLLVRSYTNGRAIAWDNGAWEKYIPSAKGQRADYMSEASRVIRYSFGTSMVFGLPGLFVQ